MSKSHKYDSEHNEAIESRPLGQASHERVNERVLIGFIDQANDFLQRISEHLQLAWPEHVNVKHKIAGARAHLNDARVDCQKCEERLGRELREGREPKNLYER